MENHKRDSRMKERLIVKHLVNFIEKDITCPIALIVGMRRIGNIESATSLE